MSAAPEHCITCSDEGVELVVLTVDEAGSMALCAAGDGERSLVEIALVEAVRAGDVLLVHAGTALIRVRAATESEARA